MRKTVGIVLLAVLVAVWGYAAAMAAEDHWSLDALQENWGVEPGGFIAEQLDLGGPRYQEVDLPNPGWLLAPAERAEAMFPQVVVAGVVDLEEGVILEEMPAR